MSVDSELRKEIIANLPPNKFDRNLMYTFSCGCTIPRADVYVRQYDTTRILKCPNHKDWFLKDMKTVSISITCGACGKTMNLSPKQINKIFCMKCLEDRLKLINKLLIARRKEVSNKKLVIQSKSKSKSKPKPKTQPKPKPKPKPIDSFRDIFEEQKQKYMLPSEKQRRQNVIKNR